MIPTGESLTFAPEEEANDRIEKETITPWQILIVDDDREVHQVTRLLLRHATLEGRPLAFLSAYDGAEACTLLRTMHKEIVIVLLDVVMEQDQAGFHVVRMIREELRDQILRILLRTGQPGIAPERATIDMYDIDDYLSKSQLSSERLYTAIRTALRAYLQIAHLQRQREMLAMMHELTSSFYALGSLHASLERILQIAYEILPTSLALLDITSTIKQKPVRYFLYLSNAADQEEAGRTALAFAEQLHHAQQTERKALLHPTQTEAFFLSDEGISGILLPLPLHPRLGTGWIYLDALEVEPFTQQMLLLLAAHASNALCATIGQALLAAQEQPASENLLL